jgi:hypothetical protein
LQQFALLPWKFASKSLDRIADCGKVCHMAIWKQVANYAEEAIVNVEAAPKDSELVRMNFRLTDTDRHWFKASAALERMSVEEWLYALAVRRAQEMDVPRPRPRG